MSLAPLPVVLPLLVAAVLAGAGNLLPRRLVDAVTLMTAGCVAGICIFLVHRASAGTIVYWFGGWKPDPHGHFPIGICFAIDPIGAGMATLVSVLMVAAFSFSWSYFESIKSLYHALMLVFLAAMCGFCLTGDVFNLFVWFELMTASAVGLCGYKSEESWPLLGALNFAVTNTIGAFLSLTGVGLLYALCGALNMAEIGRSLRTVHPDSTYLLIVFLLLIAGFLVKSAAFPFHFWLADAHAVAPTPVCILFSGVMVELGVYGIARLYWAIFAPLLGGDNHALRTVFLIIGCGGAIIGGVSCFGQRHLKRLLAFSTVSHVGLMFMGLAILTPGSLSGLAMYVFGHGMIKGSLFICAGILLHRFRSVDELDLLGRGRQFPGLAIIMLVGAYGLAGLPPFGTYYGEKFIDHAAEHLHLGWISWIAMAGEVLTAAAVVRVIARVFLGWGRVREASSRGSPHIPMGKETKGDDGGIPFWMWLPAVLLLVVGISVSTFSQSRVAVEHAVDRFTLSLDYQAEVLDARKAHESHESEAISIEIDWHVCVIAITTIGLAAVALFPGMWGRNRSRRLGRIIISAMRPLRAAQSGRIGDYVAWLVLGIALYGGLLLLVQRARPSP
jgi:multicomponent Na+:H+ antiporter subunit D